MPKLSHCPMSLHTCHCLETPLLLLSNRKPLPSSLDPRAAASRLLLRTAPCALCSRCSVGTLLHNTHRVIHHPELIPWSGLSVCCSLAPLHVPLVLACLVPLRHASLLSDATFSERPLQDSQCELVLLPVRLFPIPAVSASS